MYSQNIQICSSRHITKAYQVGRSTKGQNKKSIVSTYVHWSGEKTHTDTQTRGDRENRGATDLRARRLINVSLLLI